MNFDSNKLEKPAFFFFGEEGIGRPLETLNLREYTLEIEQYGPAKSSLDASNALISVCIPESIT